MPSTDTTARLAGFLANAAPHELPAAVRREAGRALLNWLGCALGGCRDPAVDKAWAALADFAGPPQAALIGRGAHSDAPTAALVNAIAANALDFDDTHLASVVHPTVPVAAALLALAGARRLSGAAFLHALALGIETACRLGIAVGPAHYEDGWHISGTCGVFGAAAACARALGLDAVRTAHALGIAATSAAGLRLMLGSEAKCFNLGHAARSGLTAALLAARDFTSSTRALEAPRGFLAVLAGGGDADAVTRDLGAHWELLANAYKPYPCGVVTHATIDACLDLRAQRPLDAAAIAQIELRVAPLAIQLCGNPAPRDGLEAKLSLAHGAAVALMDGAAGVAQFDDARARDPAIAALRERVVLVATPALEKDQAGATVVLRDGSRREYFVEHARGSRERPLSDDDLAAKFRALAAGVLPTARIDETLALCATLDACADAGALARAVA